MHFQQQIKRLKMLFPLANFVCIFRGGGGGGIVGLWLHFGYDLHTLSPSSDCAPACTGTAVCYLCIANTWTGITGPNHPGAAFITEQAASWPLAESLLSLLGLGWSTEAAQNLQSIQSLCLQWSEGAGKDFGEKGVLQTKENVPQRGERVFPMHFHY